MLEIRNLTKIFVENSRQPKQQLLVLDNISLSVPKNQFVCFLGPSGCGKTTLLRIIAGLIEPDSGEVLEEGKVVRGPGQNRCMVFQNYGLLPWRNVRENVEFGLEVRNTPKNERRAVCQHFIETVGLQGFEQHYPHQISGGMQQRTGLARALSKDPKILLMDEPFAAVDMQTRELLQEELLKIWNTTDTTVLFVTHSVEEAIYLADRVVVMSAQPGRLKADIEVDLPRPRYTSDVKSLPRFAELSGIAREMLREKEIAPTTEPRVMSVTDGIHVPSSVSGKARCREGKPAERANSLPNLNSEIQALQLKRKRRLTDYPNSIRIVSMVLTLTIWEWYGRGVDPIFLSYPTAIVAALPIMIAQGELQKLVFVSLAVLFVGFSSAVVLGTILGLLTGRYRLMNYLVDVHISALYSTPNVALIPLLILWFGLGMESKIIIVFLAAFFPIVVNTQGGVRNVSRGLVEIAQAEGASERQLFRKIIVPASLPFIMTGIRLAVGRAVVGMVVAEMFTAIAGLGGAIVYYSNNFVTDKLFVVVILLALLGVGLTEGVRYLEIRFAPWKETERAS
jgi:NitT/TauT family transport system ATP-binding protein